MGEAKRRKQIDPTYGKVPSLRTERDRKKHFEKILDDLHSECSSELKALITGDKAPDEYEQIRVSLGSWIENRLSDYREQDRETIANSLLLFSYEMSEEYDTNPMVFVCFTDILKSYVSPELSEKLADSLEDIVAELKTLE